MSRAFICVGGPWDGKRVVLRHGESLVLPSTEPLEFGPAVYDSMSAPPHSVTVHHHVYKRKKIAANFEGGSVQMEVLAYFGRDRQDRPEGFYL